MKAQLIMVGKTADKAFAAAVDDYAGRIAHYMPFSVSIVPALKNAGSLTMERQKEEEGRLILERAKGADCLVLLDERGEEMTSVELAGWIGRKAHSVRHMAFAIGGPYGFSPAVYAAAHAKLSLSRLTMSHQMVRLFFAEQLYRACTIIRGEAYHHA